LLLGFGNKIGQNVIHDAVDCLIGSKRNCTQIAISKRSGVVASRQRSFNGNQRGVGNSEDLLNHGKQRPDETARMNLQKKRFALPQKIIPSPILLLKHEQG
jgi:hypothetical protein